MSKYKPLADRLSGQAGDEWRASFTELEAVLGFPLPKAARSGASWWVNSPEKAHSRAWLDHGWRIGAVDRAAETVSFQRDPVAVQVQPPAMKAAAEDASKTYQIKRAAGRTALVGGVVAIAAGLGALALRMLRGRRA